MNPIRSLILIIVAQLLLLSCSTSKQSTGSSESNKSDPNLITFLVLNIHRDSLNATHVVELISKTESTGILKKQQAFTTENYLTMYAYSGKYIVDSIILEHPLYKHLEYVDEHSKFAVMDTVINTEDFFVRVQGRFDELSIFETLKNEPTKRLNTIKN